MKRVEPKVRLIAAPEINWEEMRRALNDQTGGDTDWYSRMEDLDASDAEILVEFAGRECYKSWEPGLNPNVTKVREDSKEYLWNILHSGHGSVLEHANFSFVFSNVSRVFTHEFVRHRAGVSISQESMRYVRLTDIPFWFPDWALEDDTLMKKLVSHIEQAEALQAWMADHFDLDNQPFEIKKKKTSFMRRFAPSGHATHVLGTINVRAMRHIVAMRTDFAAEEEIQIVMGQLAELALAAVPNLMQDFSVITGAFHPVYVPEFGKV